LEGEDLIARISRIFQMSHRENIIDSVNKERSNFLRRIRKKNLKFKLYSKDASLGAVVFIQKRSI
jgi:hypothetical protein